MSGTRRDIDYAYERSPRPAPVPAPRRQRSTPDENTPTSETTPMCHVFPDAVALEDLERESAMQKRRAYHASHGNVRSCPAPAGPSERWAEGRPHRARPRPSGPARSSSLIDVRAIWARINQGTQERSELTPELRTGWKTVRIFVSSTDTDFHDERELLVKEVFPALREWCELNRLHLIEVDLRWGIPEELPKKDEEFTVKMCLREIDRCFEDNGMPYFLSMTSERIGPIPMEGSVTQEWLDQYKLILGLSVTEMEIVHAAYRKNNPNALFMLRDDSFLTDIEEFAPNAKEAFVDDFDLAEEKLKVLKENISGRFGLGLGDEKQVYKYTCKYVKDDKDPKKPRLTIDEKFSKTIFEFFKHRIGTQYPPIQSKDIGNVWLAAREQQEAFMKSRCENLLGRDQIILKIMKYVTSQEEDDFLPRILIGEPGMGKSSIMAKVVDSTIRKDRDKMIPGYKGEKWRVFFHFVGAVPKSTILLDMLCRLLLEIDLIKEKDLPLGLDDAVQKTRNALANGDPQMKPVIIFIDAVNQLDRELHADRLTWLPDGPLAPCVRCVLSMVPNSTPHRTLSERESDPVRINVATLLEHDRQQLVKELLWQYRKVLTVDQMELLMEKQSSNNPLWLTIACEELRVFGDFREVDSYIKGLKDSLAELLDQVLDRFAKEAKDDRQLLKATLCLLEVSKNGLLEKELLEILTRINLYNPESVEQEMDKKGSDVKFLPTYKWARIYHTLRPFLRPYGSRGEGRLDFYHRSLSKVVQKKYLGNCFKDDSDDLPLNEAYTRWHSTLADYFDRSYRQPESNYERKLEEYPYHLSKLKDRDRLMDFLVDWKAFDLLFSTSYSLQLLSYWRQCGGYQIMEKKYQRSLKKIKDKPESREQHLELFNRSDQISQLFVQAGLLEEGLALAKECLELGKSLSCEDKEKKILKLYGHLGHIQMQMLPTDKIRSSDIPKIKQAAEYHQKAIEMLKGEEDLHGLDDKTKGYLAHQYCKKAEACIAISDRSSAFPLFGNKKAFLKEGEELIKIGLDLYKKVGDRERLLDARLIEAALHPDDLKKQHQIYWDAIRECKEMFGRFHPIMTRLCYNNAITYEQERQYAMAYKYCLEACEVAENVYGPEHKKTQMYRAMLNDPKIAAEARKSGV